MTSVDSGVETENDSNDSLATHDSQSMDVSPPSVRVNGDVEGDKKDPTPSTSGVDDDTIAFSSCEPSSSTDTSHSSSTPAATACSSMPNKEQPTWGNNFATLSERPVEFRLPALKPSTSTNDIDPPAGLSFEYVTHESLASINAAFEGQAALGYGVTRRLKMLRKYHRTCRETAIDPIMKFSLLNSERRLRRAVSTNNWELVEQLLNSGVNPNSCDELKRSPLHLAACRGYTEILQMLLQKGANPNQKDSMGNTPLHLAACTNHVSVVTLLLRAGTDVHSSDHFGRSPLQLAQTRLRLLQRSAASNPDAWQVKTEVQKVIEMMLAYLNRFGAPEADAELLSSFSSRLTLTQTSQEVDQELRGLLASLSSLSIDKTTTS